MACTTLTVSAPNAVNVSNIGFGNITGRFSTCSLDSSAIGQSIYVWFDYSGTGLWSTLSGTIQFTYNGTPNSFNFSTNVSSLLGTKGILLSGTGSTWQAGSYSGLNIINAAIQ